jgi:hypothetical protein
MSIADKTVFHCAPGQRIEFLANDIMWNGKALFDCAGPNGTNGTDGAAGHDWCVSTKHNADNAWREYNGAQPHDGGNGGDGGDGWPGGDILLDAASQHFVNGAEVVVHNDGGAPGRHGGGARGDAFGLTPSPDDCRNGTNAISTKGGHRGADGRDGRAGNAGLFLLGGTYLDGHALVAARSPVISFPQPIPASNADRAIASAANYRTECESLLKGLAPVEADATVPGIVLGKNFVWSEASSAPQQRRIQEYIVWTVSDTLKRTIVVTSGTRDWNDPNSKHDKGIAVDIAPANTWEKRLREAMRASQRLGARFNVLLEEVDPTITPEAPYGRQINMTFNNGVLTRVEAGIRAPKKDTSSRFHAWGTHFHINPAGDIGKSDPVPESWKAPVRLGGWEMAPPRPATGGTPQPNLPTNHPWYNVPARPARPWIPQVTFPILPTQDYWLRGYIQH